MKAFTITKYGPPAEVFQLLDIEEPAPEKREVKIRVCATSVNDYDWCISTGKPWEYRLIFGIFRQRKKLRIPGMEVSGIVEEVGNEVTKFKVGDAVYGDISNYGFGSYAQWLCIDERALVHKPEWMSFEEAASIPHASMLALQGLRAVGQIKEGMQILINGGGGGMGTFAVQIAKYYRAHVTGVDSAYKLEAMKTLGYDVVIDYKKEDFTQGNQKYDLILDCRTNRSLWKYLKVLAPGGKYVTVGGASGKLLQLLYLNPILKVFSSKRVALVMLRSNEDLDFIHQMLAEGSIKCAIDGPFPFEKTPMAVQRFGEASHLGKIVISMER